MAMMWTPFAVIVFFALELNMESSRFAVAAPHTTVDSLQYSTNEFDYSTTIPTGNSESFAPNDVSSIHELTTGHTEDPAVPMTTANLHVHEVLATNADRSVTTRGPCLQDQTSRNYDNMHETTAHSSQDNHKLTTTLPESSENNTVIANTIDAFNETVPTENYISTESQRESHSVGLTTESEHISYKTNELVSTTKSVVEPTTSVPEDVTAFNTVNQTDLSHNQMSTLDQNLADNQNLEFTTEFIVVEITDYTFDEERWVYDFSFEGNCSYISRNVDLIDTLLDELKGVIELLHAIAHNSELTVRSVTCNPFHVIITSDTYINTTLVLAAPIEIQFGDVNQSVYLSDIRVIHRGVAESYETTEALPLQEMIDSVYVLTFSGECAALGLMRENHDIILSDNLILDASPAASLGSDEITDSPDVKTQLSNRVTKGQTRGTDEAINGYHSNTLASDVKSGVSLSTSNAPKVFVGTERDRTTLHGDEATVFVEATGRTISTSLTTEARLIEDSNTMSTAVSKTTQTGDVDIFSTQPHRNFITSTLIPVMVENEAQLITKDNRLISSSTSKTILKTTEGVQPDSSIENGKTTFSEKQSTENTDIQTTGDMFGFADEQQMIQEQHSELFTSPSTNSDVSTLHGRSNSPTTVQNGIILSANETRELRLSFMDQLRERLSDLINISADRIGINGLECGSLRVNLTISHYSNLNYDDKIRQLVGLGFSIEVTSSENDTFVFVLKEFVKSNNAEVAGDKIEPVLPDSQSRVHLSQLQLILIIIFSVVGVTLLFLLVIFLCRHYCYSRNSKSFTLVDTHIQQFSSEDFSLTKLDRPTPIYTDQGLVIKPGATKIYTEPHSQNSQKDSIRQLSVQENPVYVSVSFTNNHPLYDNEPKLYPSYTNEDNAQDLSLEDFTYDRPSTHDSGENLCTMVTPFNDGHDNLSFSSEVMLDSGTGGEAVGEQSFVDHPYMHSNGRPEASSRM